MADVDMGFTPRRPVTAQYRPRRTSITSLMPRAHPSASSGVRSRSLDLRLELLRSSRGQLPREELAGAVQTILSERHARGALSRHHVAANQHACGRCAAGIVAARQCETSVKAALRRRRAAHAREAAAAADAAWRGELRVSLGGCGDDGGVEAAWAAATAAAARRAARQRHALVAAAHAARFLCWRAAWRRVVYIERDSVVQLHSKRMSSMALANVMRASCMIQTWWRKHQALHRLQLATYVTYFVTRKRAERTNAARLVGAFLVAARCNHRVSAMYRFRTKVRKCQHHLKVFLELRRYRLQLLTLLFDRTEAQLRRRRRDELIAEARHQQVTFAAVHRELLQAGRLRRRAAAAAGGGAAGSSGAAAARSVHSLLRLRLRHSLAELSAARCGAHTRRRLLEALLSRLTTEFRRSLPPHSVRAAAAAGLAAASPDPSSQCKTRVFTVENARQWLLPSGAEEGGGGKGRGGGGRGAAEDGDTAISAAAAAAVGGDGEAGAGGVGGHAAGGGSAAAGRLAVQS
ncbi:hypothetical protein JKP88DRAFT_285841 [Tribonema minus]|uniref:Uncharacterized protein n=1 Tax=Tribonema minus TaxID=303371 RepID=A0A835ZHD8_9STRA|nr:hypothetical protein JKP88DRAFT_285841 [Tribonema minus]